MDSRVPPLHPEGRSGQNDDRATGKGTGTGPPKGVASEMWEKFQALKKRREDVTKKSTDNRIKEIQDQALSKVEEAFTTESEQEILREHKVVSGKRKRKSEEGPTTEAAEGTRASGSGTPASSTSESLSNSGSCERSSKEEGWSSIKSYLDVNSHLQGVDRGRHAPKTKLEIQIDEAISAGDLSKAESLSEHLANREFGKKIADAIDAKRFSEKKQKEEEILKAKRKKKLPWGFDHKERWETKGNM